MAELYDAKYKGLLDAIDRLNEQKDRLRDERDGYQEVLERLVDKIADVQVSGSAARTYALHEAWAEARELLYG